MSGTPVDQPARDRIREALDETLFVEAGAGTGKTTQLVDRVIALIVDAGVPLPSIAAITFTEAAAAELRDRIRERLERTVEDAPDTVTAERCRVALDDIDMAAISTLHAFAYRLLSEHPVAAGLPPHVEVLDEVRSLLDFEARWTRWIDEVMDDPACAATVVRAHHLRIRLETDVPGLASLKDVARSLDQNWDRLDGLIDAEPSGPPPGVDRTEIGAAVARLRSLDPQSCTPGACSLVDHLLSIEPTLQALERGDDDEVLGVLADRRRHKVSKRVGNKQHCREPERHREALQAIDDACDREATRLVDDVMWRLGALVARFTRREAEQRSADGRLEFHDLLVLARRLVRSHPEARTALHHRYQRLLLDEFQDTDPIQIELAALVAAADPAVPDDWRAVDPEPGRLFLVGDAKQSIYRFRRADVGIFLAAQQRYADAEAVRLSENFRTVPPVIDWLNRFFATVLREEEGRQPGYDPLRAHRPDDSGADHRPILFGGAHPDARAGEIRELEAADVAAVLADVQHRPDAWPVWDEEVRRWRPARLDDVAVLLPARTSLLFLERALRAAGVPHRVDTGALIYDTQEVRELLAVLRVMDDPADGISLVSALRSPLFGCGDDELATYRAGGGHWDLTRTVPDTLADHRVGRAVRWLADLHQERWWREPSALLLTIIERRRALEVALALDRPRDVWRRVRFLVDQARAFEESEGGDLRDFLAWAELQSHEAARVHEPVLAEADDRSARIMTVHGAKGLEFPITVVSGLSTRFGHGRRGPSVVWSESGEIAARLTQAAQTDNFDVIADFEAEMEQSERLRLLYVALTRARDHLVVSAHHRPPRNGSARSLGQLVAETVAVDEGLHRRLADVLDRESPLSEPLGPEADGRARAEGSAFVGPGTPAERAEWIDARTDRLAVAARPGTISATALAADSANGLGAVADEVEVEVEGDAVVRRGRAGTAVGRAVHAVLQDGDLESGADLDVLAPAAASAEAVPWAAEEVAARARSAARSDAVRAALRADRHWRELPVVAPVGDRTVEGYVDLLYQDGDELVVVDYKTDRLDRAAVDDRVDRYRLQGATYAVALEQATGLMVRACVFVFATEDDPVERSIDDLAGAKAEVRALLTGD